MKEKRQVIGKALSNLVIRYVVTGGYVDSGGRIGALVCSGLARRNDTGGANGLRPDVHSTFGLLSRET